MVTIKTFLLSFCIHIVFFLMLAIPEIARADVDKAITYDEFFVTVCEPNSLLQFCDDDSTHPYCARLSDDRYYGYFGGEALKLQTDNELNNY